MPSFEVNIKSTDDSRGIQSATEETEKYTDAVGRALLADKKRADNKAAKEAVAAMSDAEKQAALSAYDLALAQEKANAQIGNTADVLGSANNTVMNIRNTWMEVASAIQVVESIYQTGKMVCEDTVGKLVEYSAQVRDMMQLTGLSAEEASRMYQVADDLEIEYGELATAMEQAAKKGFLPTIDNMALLSDQYLSLSTQQEKNALVFDTLGRSGMDLVNILELGGDKIRELNAGVDENLVLSGMTIEQTTELVKAQDDFNDQIDIFEMRIAQQLLPPLRAFYDMNEKYWDDLKNQKTSILDLFLAYKAVAGAIELVNSAMAAYERYAERVSKAAEKTAAATRTGQSFIGNAQASSVGNFYQGYGGFSWANVSLPGRAAGGPVDEGRAYWVGEAGRPEIFVPKSDGYIIPNQAGRGAVRGGDTIINVHLSSIVSLADEAYAEQKLIPIIQRALRKAY